MQLKMSVGDRKMFKQLGGSGKWFDLLMAIVCLSLTAGSIWFLFFLPGGSHHIHRWDLSVLGSLVVASGYFVRSLLTDDVSGGYVFRRKKGR